ncbi:MAG: hypothetical protein WCI00_00565 [bacterium]
MEIICWVARLYFDVVRLVNVVGIFCLYVVPKSHAMNCCITLVGIIYHNVVCPLTTNVGIPINVHALSKLHHHEFPSSTLASVL